MKSQKKLVILCRICRKEIFMIVRFILFFSLFNILTDNFLLQLSTIKIKNTIFIPVNTLPDGSLKSVMVCLICTARKLFIET